MYQPHQKFSIKFNEFNNSHFLLSQDYFPAVAKWLKLRSYICRHITLEYILIKGYMDPHIVMPTTAQDGSFLDHTEEDMRVATLA